MITGYALGPRIVLIGRESIKRAEKCSRCQLCFLPGAKTKEPWARAKRFSQFLQSRSEVNVSLFRWCGRPPTRLRWSTLTCRQCARGPSPAFPLLRLSTGCRRPAHSSHRLPKSSYLRGWCSGRIRAVT